MKALTDARERAIVRKIIWRIVPFVFLLYVISYLDRVNISYAALQMNAELSLSSEAFGFASGIFFIGYFLFEVPSNVMLEKYGARIWIARILLSWGVVAALSAFVNHAWELYLLRFLLGVAEAGFFPGIIVYLTYWFRSKELATTVAMFTAAIPVSFIIGAPLSTWVMAHVHLLGLQGWRWMLLLEGVAAVIFGFVCYFRLTDKPEQATWLSAEEKAWITAELAKDHKRHKNVKHLNVLQAMKNKKVLYLSFIYFVYQCGSLGIGYWMPLIIKSFSRSLSIEDVGMIAMLPYIVATAAMILWSRSSDLRDERKLHTAIPLAVSAVAMFGAGIAGEQHSVIAMTMLCLAMAGLYAFKSPFWALPTLFLSRSTAAISVAVINSIGNLGGFVGPYMIGVFKRHTGGSALQALAFLSALLVASFLMTAFMKTHNEPEETAEQSVGIAIS